MGGLGKRRPHTVESSRVCVWTTEVAGHRHVAGFNDVGDGQTGEGPDGHWHRVQGCEVLAAGGHFHQLTSERAEGEPEVERHARRPRA